ncbi:hypothetical protein [Paenibacillus agri]|uniref:Lipoprotein n=1 Tax=Paenibacillus agri TaxID=2744309 RepID=A0A850EWW9_9BACL|nr:hypothetical protein [Paenibacillus agri]NUU64430.1 hypothetical protein [Paenibacillus agri]
MKRAYLLLVILFTLSACDQANTSTNENNTAVIAGDINVKDATNTEVSPITVGDLSKESSEFLAEDESDPSVWGFETAYKMCTEALSEYYKAIWNGMDIDLDAYIDNENLKQYMHTKITSQYELFLKNNLTDNLVTGIDISVNKVEQVGGDKRFFYLKLDARVEKDVGSYAEPTEFLVQVLNGRLVIVDWYTNGKDSYDAIVRGENQAIHNPEIWNNSDWVKELTRRILVQSQ